MKIRVATLIALLTALLCTPLATLAAPTVDPVAPTQSQRLFLPAMHQDAASAAALTQPEPLHSRAFGKSLSEWLVLHSRWQLGDFDSDGVGKVRFIPLPAGEAIPPATPDDPFILTGHQDVTLAPGTPFVLPFFLWIGERYADGSEDPTLPAEVFTSMEVLVTLDGETLIDSSVDDLSRYYFGPVTYQSPIEADLGGTVHTFLWVQGIGLVHHPLPVGEHTITLSEVISDPAVLEAIGLTGVASGFGYENSWTITVEPVKGKP